MWEWIRQTVAKPPEHLLYTRLPAGQTDADYYRVAEIDRQLSDKRTPVKSPLERLCQSAIEIVSKVKNALLQIRYRRERSPFE